MDALIASRSQHVSEITIKRFLDEASPHNFKKSLDDILQQIHQFTGHVRDGSRVTEMDMSWRPLTC